MKKTNSSCQESIKIKLWEQLSSHDRVLRLLPFLGKYFSENRVGRYLKPGIYLDGFFLEMNRKRIRYVVLRWFEDLPHVEPGGDLDILVHDEDLPRIKDFFWPFKSGIKIDLYSVAGVCDYYGGPYLPEGFALEILEHRVMYKGKYYVPDPHRHFFSLAYHAVYQKHERSGLLHRGEVKKADTPGKVNRRRPYGLILEEKREQLAFDVDIHFEGLHEFLSSKGYSPSPEALKGLARVFPDSLWLCGLCNSFKDESCSSLKGGMEPGDQALSWEEAFVPGYGLREFVSDLFGFAWDGPRKMVDFSRYVPIDLSPDLLLGTGDNRSCYAFPDNPDRCIKIDKPLQESSFNSPRKRIKKVLMPWLIDFSSNRQEARFFRKTASKHGDAFYRHAPRCYGVVFTKLGPGLVFERIRDHDGEDSERLEIFLKKNPDRTDQIISCLQNLHAILRDWKINLFDLKQSNFLFRRNSANEEQLVVIDWKRANMPSDDLPFTSIFPFLAERKMGRKVRETISKIAQIR